MASPSNHFKGVHTPTHILKVQCIKDVPYHSILNTEAKLELEVRADYGHIHHSRAGTDHQFHYTLVATFLQEKQVDIEYFTVPYHNSV